MVRGKILFRYHRAMANTIKIANMERRIEVLSIESLFVITDHFYGHLPLHIHENFREKNSMMRSVRF